jgi:hypothetical protein
MEMNALYLEQQALLASFALNSDLLTENSAWGYSGSKDDFDRLYKEVLAIADLDGIDPGSIDEICEAFWDIQLDVMNGYRAVGWYL